MIVDTEQRAGESENLTESDENSGVYLAFRRSEESETKQNYSGDNYNYRRNELHHVGRFSMLFRLRRSPAPYSRIRSHGIKNM